MIPPPQLLPYRMLCFLNGESHGAREPTVLVGFVGLVVGRRKASLTLNRLPRRTHSAL